MEVDANLRSAPRTNRSSRSSAGTSPKSSSTAGRSSTARRRTSCSVATTSSRSSATAARRGLVAERLLERLQPEQDRGQRLPRLVVELAREPLALELLRLHDAADGVPRHALRQLDGDGGPGGERLGEPEVVVGEARVGAVLVVDLDHTDRLVARDQRHPEAGAGAELPRDLLVHLGIVEHRVDPLAPPALEHRARSSTRSVRSSSPSRSSAPRHGREPQVVAAARQGDGDDAARPTQLAQPADDEVEQPLEIGLGRKCVADLVQRLELARPAGRRLVEARVLDRHRCLAGEERDELLVLVRELLAALLLGRGRGCRRRRRAAGSARRGSCASADGPAGSRPSADPP